MLKRSKLLFKNNRQDERTKFVNERLHLVDKHFGELCSTFSSYTRKLARFRDKHDMLARAFKGYSDEESINRTLSSSLIKFSRSITMVADYMHKQVQTMEFKIVNELVQYDAMLKNARDILKDILAHREKEVARQKQLMDIKKRFVAKSSSADSELAKINLEISRTDQEINEIVYNFEKQKLRDIKSILLDYIRIQLKQFTKSLEVLSAAYLEISEINIDDDMAELEKALGIEKKSQTPPETAPKLKSQSMNDVGIPTTSLNEEILGRFSKSTKNLPVKLEEEELKPTVSKKTLQIQDDDEDEDEDEESSEESDEESSSSSVDEKSHPEVNSQFKAKHVQVAKANDTEIKKSFKSYCEGYVMPKNSPRNTFKNTSESYRRRQKYFIKSINGIIAMKKN